MSLRKRGKEYDQKELVPHRLRASLHHQVILNTSLRKRGKEYDSKESVRKRENVRNRGSKRERLNIRRFIQDNANVNLLYASFCGIRFRSRAWLRVCDMYDTVIHYFSPQLVFYTFVGLICEQMFKAFQYQRMIEKATIATPSVFFLGAILFTDSCGLDALG